MSIEVLKPGLLTTLQDVGRTGAQRLGVSPCGAMDEWSHRLANIGIGNDPDSATLECTLIGPCLLFTRDTWACLAGANLGAVIATGGSREVAPITAPLYRPFHIRQGDVLDFRRRRTGVRCYLAVPGGFDSQSVFGSRSTHTRTRMGGVAGRALQKGDVLGWPRGDASASMREIPPDLRLTPAGDSPVVSYTAGREFSQFEQASIDDFDSQAFAITPESDRMAYRLRGPQLRRKADVPDILSEAVTFGTVQVPPSGQPILLMADRQTAGGYPRIAQVAKVDLGLLAQLMPGESFRFQRVSLDDAQRALLARDELFADLQQRKE